MKLKFKGKPIKLVNKSTISKHTEFDADLLDYNIYVAKPTHEYSYKRLNKNTTYLCDITCKDELIIYDKECFSNKQEAIQFCLDYIENDLKERLKEFRKERSILDKYLSM